MPTAQGVAPPFHVQFHADKMIKNEKSSVYILFISLLVAGFLNFVAF
jgi:hypothetical protein